MKPIVVPRLPTVTIVVATAVLVLHFVLCLPAATSRGFPSINPFWETVARYITFLGFVLFPIFDDRLDVRRLVRNFFVPLACLMNGVVGTNLMSATPRVGNSIGVSGILIEDTLSVIFLAIIHMALSFPIAYAADAIGMALWGSCRSFSDPHGRGGSFRFTTIALLTIVAVSAGVCGGVHWLQRLFDSWPGDHWSDDCRQNLKQIAIAIRNYESQFRTLPPAYIADDSGAPAHSWRVLLLPFLDHKELYDAYRFDEAWNGPNNHKLIGRMPSVYGCRWDAGRKSGQTSYVVITGDGTAFPGTRSVPLRSIRDGTSSTILCVECSRSGIHWSEPRDLTFDGESMPVGTATANSMRTIHGSHDLGAQVVFADGSRRWLSHSTSPEVVMSLLSIAGGERLDEF
jgi:hypothetical protein